MYGTGLSSVTGGKTAKECIAENVCEQSAAISRMTGQPVPIQVTLSSRPIFSIKAFSCFMRMMAL